jgi:hypothetical protein
VGALLLAAALPAPAAAQCAMCAESAAAAGEGHGGLRALLIGVLILLIASFVLISAFAILVWKFRHADGAAAQSKLGT